MNRVIRNLGGHNASIPRAGGGNNSDLDWMQAARRYDKQRRPGMLRAEVYHTRDELRFRQSLDK